MLREVSYPVVILALVVLGLASFGAIGLTTSLLTAVSIGIMVLGGALLLRGAAQPGVGVVLLGIGGVMFLFRNQFDALTIGEALTALGGP